MDMESTQEQFTNNHVTLKYKIAVRGIMLEFASYKRIDCNNNNLEAYFENSMRSKEQNDSSLAFKLEQLAELALIQQSNHLSSSNVEVMNSLFIEIMEMYSSLLDEYYKHTTENITSTNSEPSSKSPNASYVFKQPRNKTKQSAFEKYWKEHFNQLREYKTQFGHCNVSRTTAGFAQLGNWLTDQRRKLRGGKLTREQYEMMTELGKDIVWFVLI